MNKTIVYIAKDKLRKGMILASDIHDKAGSVLISEGAVLADFHIAKINSDDELSEIAIYEKQHDTPAESMLMSGKASSVRVSLIRKRALNKIREVLNEIVDKKNQSMSVLFEIADEVILEVLESDKLIFELDRLQSADDYLYSHMINSAVISIFVGIAMGLDKPRLVSLARGAFFSDIGKLQLNSSTLNKATELTQEEIEDIKNYPEYGYDFVENYAELDDNSKKSILESREKWDGSGYPKGLKGSEISIYGQIVSFATFFDALTSDRPYRMGISPYEAMSMAIKEAGKSFDPVLVKKAAAILGYYNVGMVLRLKSGEITKVTKVDRYNPTMNVIFDPNVDVLTHAYEIDMRKNPTIRIKSVLLEDEQTKIFESRYR